VITQNTNPLIGIPSPRDIPQVKKLWHTLPYDKFIVKYKTQIEAYQEIKEYFLTHDYTHLILCPDDLEVTPEAIEKLSDSATRYETISGICNIDESQPDVYNIQPKGCSFERNKPDTTKAVWYSSLTLPKEDIIEVGYSGFACQVISKDLMKKVSFLGAREGIGYFDWQFSKECHNLGVPLMVDIGVKLWHRRTEQKPINRDGYSFLISSFSH